MGKQVITVGEGGAISGLQRKKGQGLNLQEFGQAKTERVSEIEWHEDAQAWFVKPIRGPYAGGALTANLWEELMGHPPQGLLRADPLTKVLYFADYDDAVAAEVAFLDAARLKGIF